MFKKKSLFQQALSKLQSQMTTVPTQAQPRARTQGPASMEEYLNYGMGPARKYYSTEGAGTMSMSPLGGSDALVGKLSNDLLGMGMKFAEGGKVTMSAGAMKTMKDKLRELQNDDRERALMTLRESRESLDFADGGEVAQPGQQMGDADPQALYMHYEQLKQALESGKLDENQEMQILQQMQQIEQMLTSMGIDVSSEGGEGGGQGGGQEKPADLKAMMQQLTQGMSGIGQG